jgi:hypothetical protein
MYQRLLAGILAFVSAVPFSVPPGSAQSPADVPPFQVQAIHRGQWTAEEFPPPGIAWADDSVTIVTPMEFPDPCHGPDVQVTSTLGRSPGETALTVHIRRPRSRLGPRMGCMAVIWPVYVVVSIPGLAPGQYSVEVRAPIYFVSVQMPARGRHSDGAIRP